MRLLILMLNIIHKSKLWGIFRKTEPPIPEDRVVRGADDIPEAKPHPESAPTPDPEPSALNPEPPAPEKKTGLLTNEDWEKMMEADRKAGEDLLSKDPKLFK